MWHWCGRFSFLCPGQTLAISHSLLLKPGCGLMILNKVLGPFLTSSSIHPSIRSFHKHGEHPQRASIAAGGTSEKKPDASSHGAYPFSWG